MVLNNFPDNDKPLQLVCKTFQNMFPAIDPEKIAIKRCRRVLLLQYDAVSDAIISSLDDIDDSPPPLRNHALGDRRWPGGGEHREEVASGPSRAE